MAPPQGSAAGAPDAAIVANCDAAGRSGRSRFVRKSGWAADREPPSSRLMTEYWIKIEQFSWQEWQGSNLRPPVLETGALPIELHSYVGVAAERAV